jgi:hypothetical protein
MVLNGDTARSDICMRLRPLPSLDSQRSQLTADDRRIHWTSGGYEQRDIAPANFVAAIVAIAESTAATGS